MTDWKPICRGAIGIEFTLCGFGGGRDLFHHYLCLGVVTLYVTTKPLYRLVKIMQATRAALRSDGE